MSYTPAGRDPTQQTENFMSGAAILVFWKQTHISY